MSAVAVKSGMVGMWGRLEIWLWLFVELAALPAFAIWGDVHSPDRTALAGGVVELRENALFIISGIALCLAMLALSSAIIWRRRRRGQRFALMELLILGVGVVWEHLLCVPRRPA